MFLLRYTLTCLLLFQTWTQASHAATGPSDTTPAMQAMLSEFRRLDELTQLVQQHFVEPVSREDLWHGAFHGMLAGLDKHSRYLTPKEVLLRNRIVDDVDQGFGFDWRHDPDNRRLIISRIVPGGPAAAAGLVRGDELLRADGIDLQHLTLQAVTEQLLALENPCTLHVRHADGKQAALTIARKAYADHGVTSSRWADEEQRIAVIGIDRFIGGSAAKEKTKGGTVAARTRTGKAFRAELEALQKNGVKGLIIDLRGNGGGSLLAAVEVADCFLDASPNDGTVIVSQASRHPDHQARYVASSQTSFPNWPLVVLVDADTASSAEILAAALRDHSRAVLVGNATMGKDSVQQQFALGDGSAMRLTVARYRTPSGRLISDGGLKPDIVVRDADLDRFHRARSKKDADILKHDRPLQRARDVLTAILITGRRIGLP